jgi:hypothetical protein
LLAGLFSGRQSLFTAYKIGGAQVSTEVGSEGGMPGTPVGLVKKLAQTQTPTTTFVTHWLLNCSHVLSSIACVGLEDVISAG